MSHQDALKPLSFSLSSSSLSLPVSFSVPSVRCAIDAKISKKFCVYVYARAYIYILYFSLHIYLSFLRPFITHTHSGTRTLDSSAPNSPSGTTRPGKIKYLSTEPSFEQCPLLFLLCVPTANTKQTEETYSTDEIGGWLAVTRSPA